MIVYRDRCYCCAKNCKHYRQCEDSYYSGVKERDNHPDVTNRLLPIDFCDMSKTCDHFVEVTKMVGE